MTSPASPRPLHVTIVAESRETLDGLEAYLRAAGVTARGKRSMAIESFSGADDCTAIVLFPDEFEVDIVDTALRALRDRCPSVLPVVVTKNPKRFEETTPAGMLAPIIIGKPAWGWTILDAIRGRIATD